MTEFKSDLSDPDRCISVHGALPVQCVLPSHLSVWHEARHPETGNRIRYRWALGVYRTEEMRDGTWTVLDIPPPAGAADAVRALITRWEQDAADMLAGGGEHEHVVGAIARAARVEEIARCGAQLRAAVAAEETPETEAATDLDAIRARAEQDGPALLTEVEQLRTALDEVLKERDEREELLDTFAYTVAPLAVIGEHSSGNDPWARALDMLTSAASVQRLREELASARADADRLREGNRKLSEQLKLGAQGLKEAESDLAAAEQARDAARRGLRRERAERDKAWDLRDRAEAERDEARAELDRVRGIAADQARVLGITHRTEVAQAAYEAMDAERRGWESRRAVENVARAELIRDRDRAREIAVALEQQLAEIEKAAYEGGQDDATVRRRILGVFQAATPKGAYDDETAMRAIIFEAARRVEAGEDR